MNDEQVEQFLSARLASRLAAKGSTDDDPRSETPHLVVCLRTILGRLMPEDRNHAERILAEEMNELLSRVCFAVNAQRRERHVLQTLQRHGLVAAVQAECDGVREVLDLFQTYGA